VGRFFLADDPVPRQTLVSGPLAIAIRIFDNSSFVDDMYTPVFSLIYEVHVLLAYPLSLLRSVFTKAARARPCKFWALALGFLDYMSSRATFRRFPV
jgi:hypothetical protein